MCEEGIRYYFGAAVRNWAPMSPCMCLTPIVHLSLLYKMVHHLQSESPPVPPNQSLQLFGIYDHTGMSQTIQIKITIKGNNSQI